MFRIGVVCLALFAISACATDVNLAPTNQLVSSERVTDKNYEIDSVRETFVGDTMIRVRDYKQDIYGGTQVRVNKSFSFGGPLFKRDFSEGETFPYGGKVKFNGQDTDFFLVDGFRGILFDERGEIKEKMLANSGATNVFVIYTYKNDGGSGAVSRESVRKATNSPDGQNFEIIYSGIDGDSIRLQYREYTDDNAARQAFFQDLTYPRDAGQIRFRNLLLKVLSAESDKIVFSVENDSQ